MQRVARAGNVLQHKVKLAARHDLEAGQPLAAARLQIGQQFHGAFNAFDANPGGHAHFGLRVQLEHGGGDNAKRAFGANEKLFQVVAGIVLA